MLSKKFFKKNMFERVVVRFHTNIDNVIVLTREKETCQQEIAFPLSQNPNYLIVARPALASM